MITCILNIETSAEICSVVLAHNGKTVFKKIDNGERNHAEKLGLFVDQALSFANDSGYSLRAVAVSSGPGSYTGLRIGASMAKGLCYGGNIPLIAIPTLEILCNEFFATTSKIETNALLCPMIDARRMEVYSAIYDFNMTEIRKVQADIVTKETYKTLLDEHPIYFFGDGEEKCREVVTHHNARFIEGIRPTAKGMVSLSERRFKLHKYEDVAYFTPFYLKDFVAGQAKGVLNLT